MNLHVPRDGGTRCPRHPRAFRLGRPAPFVIGLACSLVPFVACAGGGESPTADLAKDGAVSPDTSNVPDSSLAGDGPTPEEASADAAKPIRCSPGGFCYMPVPVLKPIWAVSGSSRDDVWAIGSEGPVPTYGDDVILRWDGGAWKVAYRVALQTSEMRSLIGIWASKENDVWVLGEGIIRYTERSGFRQLAIPDPPGNSVPFTTGWATPTADALWVVGGQEEVLRFREEPVGTLVVDHWIPQVGAEEAQTYVGYRWTGVWGFGPDDVYVAGRACKNSSCGGSAGVSALAHYNGTDWSITTLDGGINIASLFGTPPGVPPHLCLTMEVIELRPPYSVRRMMTQLAPVTNDGIIGAPVFSQLLNDHDYGRELGGSVMRG